MNECAALPVHQGWEIPSGSLGLLKDH